MSDIQVGDSATREFVVGDEDTATALGSGDVSVLGTPRAIAWAESVTVAAVAERLDDNETTVGSRVCGARSGVAGGRDRRRDRLGGRGGSTPSPVRGHVGEPRRSHRPVGVRAASCGGSRGVSGFTGRMMGQSQRARVSQFASAESKARTGVKSPIVRARVFARALRPANTSSITR